MDDLYRLAVTQRVLSEAGVRWWVDHGTLLGLVREQRLLPWDADIDLSIEAQDLGRCYRALWVAKAELGAHVVRTRRNVKVLPARTHGRELDISAYFPVTDSVYRKYLVMFPRTPGLWFGSTRRQVWRRHRDMERVLRGLSNLGVGARDETGPVARCHGLCFDLITRSRERFGVLHASEVDAGFFARLTHWPWRNLSLPVPTAPEVYLAHRYGSDWRTPRQDWTWWQDDATVTSASS